MNKYIEQKVNLEKQGWRVSRSIGGKSHFGKDGISGLVAVVDQATGDLEMHKGCPEDFAKKHMPTWGGERKGAGRPEVEDKKTSRSIKFSDAEWEAVRERAESKGMTISAYVRESALKK